MNNNGEYAESERLLRRVRPSEPSAELKSRVLHAAQGAWRGASEGVPWPIPIRRLFASAAAATILVCLANLYGDHASAHRPVVAPVAGHTEPCDFDVMTDSEAPLIRYAVTGRPAQPDASTLCDYLERVRRALSETERNEAPDNPAPVERRSRLPRIPSSLNS
jgi:hypothetical protein